ncbi:MAG: phosphohistidine phosphatase SixA [Calditrichaeota bacterium]|nr:MAG: phosphohistidine phosphatase SixA [Calditrichota bacterium]
MKIYILRHGIALDRNDPNILSDKSRQLVPIGIEKITNISKFIKKQKINFDLIFSSPYLRAKETAVIVAEKLGVEIQETELLIPSGSFERLIEKINSQNFENVLLVGHEPFLSGFASFLLVGDESLDLLLKKGGFCCVGFYGKIEIGMGTLDFLLSPKQMISKKMR